MPTLPEIENAKTDAPSSAASATRPPKPSRWLAVLDAFFKYAGAVAVDHTHLLPLDRVSGRTGLFAPPTPKRCC